MTIPRLSSRDSIPNTLRGGIAALGNFDGFHLGHQAVAGEAIAQAKAQGRPAIIATFDPHPVRYFTPDAPPFRLTTLDQRQRLFEAAGADAMLAYAGAVNALSGFDGYKPLTPEAAIAAAQAEETR
jgi:riboflavin kinase/FMN adenylyltransferase